MTDNSGALTVGQVIGLDAAAITLRQADHQALTLRDVLLSLGQNRDELLILTHVAPTPFPHFAISIRIREALQRNTIALLSKTLATSGSSDAASADEVGVWTRTDPPSGLPALKQGARDAATANASGSGGRAVCFAGCDRVPHELSVAEVQQTTAIDEVVSLGGVDCSITSTLLRTRGHLRPLLTDGRLVLQVQPANGCLVPFESPEPTPCCVEHD